VSAYAENQNKLNARPGDVVMTYSGPRVVLETEYGQCTAVFTDSGHASVTCGDDTYGRAPHLNDDNPGFTFRGERYLGHEHLFAEHGWQPHPRGHRDFYPYSTFTRASNGADAPPSYAAKMRQAMTAAVAAFAAARPAVLRAAERNHLSHELASAQEAASKASNAASEARAAVAELEARIAGI
jgi:hypothetical protein